MPTGIILSSGSQGATQEDINKVLLKNGYEIEAPEVTAETKKEEAEAEAKKKEDIEADTEQETEPQRLSRRQKAVQKATEQMRAELKAANERIAALEKGGKGKKEESEPEPEEKGAPKREAFASDEEFQDAMFDFRYEERRQKEEKLSAERAEADRLQKNWNGYKEKVATFKEDHDDWDDVMSANIPIQESVYLAVHELENGPEVAYYLGKNPDYAKKLHAMSSLSAIMEIGNLSQRLKPKSAKREADEVRGSTKKIPDPVEPVSTAATTSTSTSRDAAAKRDFKAFKRAQRTGK
jgi:scaffolding protein